MARATAAETSERIDTLQKLILEGESNTACLALPELSATAESFTKMRDAIALLRYVLLVQVHGTGLRHPGLFCVLVVKPPTAARSSNQNKAFCAE